MTFSILFVVYLVGYLSGLASCAFYDLMQQLKGK